MFLTNYFKFFNQNTEAAKLYSNKTLNHTTLMSQFTNQSISHHETKSTQFKLLSNAQKEMSATFQILKNLVIELIQKSIEKN